MKKVKKSLAEAKAWQTDAWDWFLGVSLIVGVAFTAWLMLTLSAY
jgi:hypothetical protein